jgi:hypothetical protein
MAGSRPAMTNFLLIFLCVKSLFQRQAAKGAKVRKEETTKKPSCPDLIHGCPV